MKKIYYIVAVLVLFFTACNQKWDDYYFGNSATEEELETTIAQYLAAHPEYSEFTSMLNKTGLYSELQRDQQMTVWVADNNAMNVSGITDTDTLRMKYHMNHLPFQRSDLKTGLRILSLNGIYFQIGSQNDTLYANDSKIVKSIRLKDGVVHVLSSLMKSRINIYDYMEKLGPDYSMIRDSIFKYSTKVFDKANSIPIGVDKTGNTIYDSVFYVSNPIFTTSAFNSEFKQFTVFLPNNQVIHDCFSTLATTYAKMGKTVTKADSTTAWAWIKKAMFYSGVMTSFTAKDITSAAGAVWRTTVQKIDDSNPNYMSNGVIYNMTRMKIPNNVVITRIKSLVEYWEYQDVDKLYPNNSGADDLYTFKGLVGNPSVFVADATPKTSVMPNYIVFQASGDANSTDEFSVEFPPLEKYYSSDDSKYHVRVMSVPTGEYNLYMGFQSSGHPYVNVFFNDVAVGTEIKVTDSTPWNYDRVTETEKDLNPTNGTAKWDGLGGLVGTVTVAKDDGTEGMASFKIKVKWSRNDPSGVKRMRIYHWALKPTANNY